MISTTTTTPLTYYIFRLFLSLVLRIFYRTIVVENAHLIPGDGDACIICSNHDNSVTDALVVVTSIPLKRRSMLRTTAKSTHFGKKTFVSWLIENIGAIPVKRRVDFAEGQIDNTDAMEKLYEALEAGEAITFFPEGISRYHPSLAPMKTGVARIVSDVLTRNASHSNFEVSIVPCSITYTNRQYFRSDVLVSFQPPIRCTPKDNPDLIEPVDFSRIRALTATIQDRVGAGTLHAPSWRLIRSAKMAGQLYAPLGTQISLGDHVRVSKVFLEIFKTAAVEQPLASQESKRGLHVLAPNVQRDKIMQLCNELNEYKDELTRLSIPDQRILRPLNAPTIVGLIVARLLWSTVLLASALPGLVFWAPIFGVCHYAVRAFRRRGMRTETEVRLAHTKQVSGILGMVIVLSCTLLYELVCPSGLIVFTPLIMWITLRWLEDGLYSLHSLIVLVRLIFIDRSRLHHLYVMRTSLLGRVTELALHTVGLPADATELFPDVEIRPESGTRLMDVWKGRMDYFSLLRRRKKDWNEVFGIWDVADYPEDEPSTFHIVSKPEAKSA